MNGYMRAEYVMSEKVPIMIFDM
ncbi:hypothetical protein F383_30319 [Gossypium arboreum]|uniref:Uncharacterized protein n=1 Tax=Gossypium arboreum TaxID=29729 RepID=A0A0B0PII2_GOSAR|nr:hypothetical protein F383_30319 [Gossypium arboreum]